MDPYDPNLFVHQTLRDSLTPENGHPASKPAEDAVGEETADLLAQASRLSGRSKLALIRKLLTQLDNEQIQTLLEFGLREIGDRSRRGHTTAAVDSQTRLLLKKDYSYQDRGLQEPTQYYVYLRRRQPKLDRYIGALFYVPAGCSLSYGADAAGYLNFNPPHNTFRLQDCKNPTVTRVVRLVGLQPPPPDYTFTKQQNDTPAILLHLEDLDPQSYQPLERQTYPFPACMYEGGELDRYRWEVSKLLIPAPDLIPPEVAPRPVQQPLEPTKIPVLTFTLVDRNNEALVLKRMQLWITWSEKVMAESTWDMVQEDGVYTLRNQRFKHSILKFAPDRGILILEHSLPVLLKWFHDLSLAVAQPQHQKRFSATQLKLAHQLLVEMSLPQTDPLIVVQQLFGLEFSLVSP